MKKLSLIIFNFAILLLLFSINSKYSFAACIDSDSFDYTTINFNQQGTATSGQDSLTDYCTANVLLSIIAIAQVMTEFSTLSITAMRVAAMESARK